MKRIFVVLLFIICIAAFLRMWHLGGVPISLNWDEAAIGYNAYSILKTGKDEYGISFPIVLRSFGNYTPAFLAYLVVPSVFVFDLAPADQERSIRLHWQKGNLERMASTW